MNTILIASTLMSVLCCHLANIEASYITCIPGTGLPIILSAPHGGSEKPESIQDRTDGCDYDPTTETCTWSHACTTTDHSKCRGVITSDWRTKEMAYEMAADMSAKFGKGPWLVVNNLHRKKMDANRDVNEATFGEAEAVTAWNEYMQCLTYARSNITDKNGKGLIIDLHGQNHKIVRVEVGNLVTKSRQNPGGSPPLAKYSSLKHLDGITNGTFLDLLRGPNSFGDLLWKEGYNAVPSPNDTHPGTASMFTGGYLLTEYGSKCGGTIDGVQIESPKLYRSDDMRAGYVAALTNAVKQYFEIHYRTTL